MDYSTMEAGREMDALVAEKVMGHEVSSYWFRGVDVGHESLGNNLGRNLAKYSTDIAAAWDVVDATKHPFEIFISGKKNIPFASAKIIIGDDCFEVSADTAPLAICRAALMAVLKIESNKE